MGSMGHDNESAFIEHWVNEGDGAESMIWRFPSSVWKRLEEASVAEIPQERKKVVTINGHSRAFDVELWKEVKATCYPE
jgi:hypothetical protein